MRRAENIEKLIKSAEAETTKDVDERILGDAMKDLGELKKVRPAIDARSVWRRIMRSMVMKIAAIITVIGAVAIGVIYLDGNKGTSRDVAGTNEGAKEQDSRVQLNVELASIETMAKSKDVGGLIMMLDKGLPESKIAAANFLANMGDMRAIKPLEKLANEWEGEDGVNPFARAADWAKWTEGKAMMKTIATGIRAYWAESMQAPPDDSIEALGFRADDLRGTYFDASMFKFKVGSVKPLKFVVIARNDEVRPAQMKLDQDGFFSEE